MVKPVDPNKSRERLFNALTKGASRVGLTPKTTIGATDIGAFFQRGPIGSSMSGGAGVYDSVFGSADDFLSRYVAFEKAYFKELHNNIGRVKGGKVTESLMRKRGSIDLTLLPLETSNKLAEIFKTEVMRVDRLIEEVGLPSIEMPSANLYRHAFKFEVDNTAGIAHPAQLLLNSLIFNFNPERQGLESLSLRRSDMLGSAGIKRQWDRFEDLTRQRVAGTITEAEFQKKVFSPFSDMKAGQKIITFDSETTGVTKGSQIRSLAMREMEIGPDGEIIYDLKKSVLDEFDKAFNSPKLYGITVPNLISGTTPLNQFLSSIETPTKDMGPGGKVFLDEAASFLERLMEADKIAGHNVMFDIGKIVDTIYAQEGFLDHKPVQKILNQFLDKVQNEDFVIDTLTYSRMYLQNQAQQMVGAAADSTDIVEGSKKIIDNLMSQEVLAKVQTGGSAAYASVENIALNTNLFELIEKDEQAAELLDKLKGGSHVASTDVHLQSFIAKYVHSGKLAIRAKAIYESIGDPFTDFGRWARSVIARSSAVTPTSNIAAVQHLSQTALNYVKSEGLSDVKLMLSSDDSVFGSILRSAGIDPATKEPVILTGRQSGGFRFYAKGRQVDIDDPARVDQVRTLIERTIEEAKADGIDERFATTSRELLGKTVQRNRAAEKILSLGISIDQMSRAAEIAQRGFVAIDPLSNVDEVNLQRLASATKSVYRNLGTGLTASDQLRFLLGRDFGGSVFNAGIADFDFDTSRKIAQEFGKIGDPFANVLDMRSRVFSMIMANITSQTAQEAGQAALMAGVDADLIAHTSHANLTSGLGVSYFKSQDVVRLFDVSRDTGLASSKPMVPLPVFRKALEEAGLADVGIRAGLSTVDRGTVNVVADLARSGLDRAQAENLAQKLLEVVSDEDALKSLTGVDEVAGRTADEMARAKLLKTSSDPVKLVQDLTDFIMDRGLVVMKAEGEQAFQIADEIERANELIENDKTTRMAGNILFDSGLGPEYGVIGPFSDEKAAEIAAEDFRTAGKSAELTAADDTVDVGGQKLSRILKTKGDLAGSIDRVKDGAKRLKIELDREKYGLPENKALSFYMSHKTAFRATALGVAAAGIGYYVAKRYRENNLYDETLEQQPIQANNSVRPMNQSANAYTRMDQSPMDPLTTAGVVGNLDRRKVGHTQMGNNKYNHLYGG